MNNMDNSTIERLKDKISTDPSVLFLGQDYLSSKTGKNIFYDLVNENLCDGQLCQVTSYTEVWEKINGGKPLDDSTFEKMRDVLSQIPEQRWLRKVLNMRWGMVITSAIDGVLYRCVGQEFSMRPIDMNRRYFDRKYISKRSLNTSFLYGTIDGMNDAYPPKDCSHSTFVKNRKKVNDRIEWIYSHILSEYGVLVIDGWNPKYDWMSNLLNNAGEMPDESIYLFGVKKETLDNADISSLIESGILRVDERSFVQALEEIDFFDDTSDDIREEYGVNERIITINNDKSKMFLAVSDEEMMRLDSHIAVLYDEVWHAIVAPQMEMPVLYAQFQQQADMPVWYLYDDRYGFYFERTLYRQLEEVVEKELHNTSYKRKYIILEGNSNVGKTTLLAHLAYMKRNDIPIIYISGEPTQPEWMEDLKEFIKTQLIEWQKTGKKVSSVLVIWDANTDYHAVQRCKQLNDILRECNSVVVGSAYRMRQPENSKSYYKDKAKNHHLFLTAQLEPEEVNGMLDSLKKIDMDTAAVVQKDIDKKGMYLMRVLQILHLRYREEWRLVAESLKIHFNREVEASEAAVEAKAKKYMDDLASKVAEEIQKYGIATAWQLQLAKIKEDLGWGKEIDEEKQKQLDRFERVEKHISKMNEILAVAGEFAVFIPLTLLLRMITDVEARIFSDEQTFLIDIIENDSLLRSRRDDQGYVSVSFRHQTEATMYIENNFGNSFDERKIKEINLLKQMIAECKWYDEQESTAILTLVRCFGPNSWGSERAPRGEKDRHYMEYEEWWVDIAESLNEVIDDQPEGILVYAMLIRSHCREEINQIEKNEDSSPQIQKELIREPLKELATAKRMLEDAINRHDQSNKNQLCRLLGEICSNLVYAMKQSENLITCETQFRELKVRFAQAVQNWSENNSPNIFTKNALLDIWLNGVDNYLEKKKDNGYIELMKDPECSEAVSDSIHYIDELLDLSEDSFDNAVLISKVEKIYNYAESDDLIKLQEKLDKSSNDTFLYLMAWKCWDMKEDIAVDNFDNEEEKEYLKNYVRNLYLIPDDFDRLEIGMKSAFILKEYAKSSATEALKILEEKEKLIYRSKSTRCIIMMIRAKWLLYTGNMPLETKQRPTLTLSQWNEIGQLCKKYITYADQKKEKLRDAVVFLRMIYVWSFSKDKDEFERLRDRQNMLRANEWYFERICLCNVGTNTPKLFNVNLQLRKEKQNKYNAIVVASNDGIRDEIAVNVKNRQVHVPDFVAQELMGSEFGSIKFNIKQSVVIWFNAKGPQIGLPEKGEK